MLEPRPTSAEPDFVEDFLSVLGYQEDGEWVALALEMDLRGYGDTWDKALRELNDLVVTQIGFALSKNQPEMIWKDAEPWYWSRFREVQRARLTARSSADADAHASGLRVPSPLVIAARFSPVNA